MSCPANCTMANFSCMYRMRFSHPNPFGPHKSFYIPLYISSCPFAQLALCETGICRLIGLGAHFNSPAVASNCSLFQPIKARFLYSSSGISSRKSLFSGFRADHTMASQSTQTQSVHDFIIKDAQRNDVDLSTYKGKVLLIVNVASQCGLTNSNYTELTKLYEKYKDQGFEILAFPCNQFGSQEPGTNEQIQDFACTRFKAEYPIFDKIEVNGPNAAPLYKYLKSVKGGFLGDKIKWNFSKFLVDQEGHVVDRYAPTTSPLSIEKDIKKLLENGANI